MKALNALNIINDISSSQRGFFTAAQATALGIGRMTLSRLAARGQIMTIMRGVFKAAAAPAIREEDVYAAWLLTDPATPAYLRPFDSSGYVASLETAAWLLDLGVFKPEPITFSFPKRKQSRNASLRFVKRSLCDEDVCVVAGIPTTMPKRTILDLLDYGEDLSLIADALQDFLQDVKLANHTDRPMKIKDDINSRAQKCGFDKNFDLYAYLRKE